MAVHDTIKRCSRQGKTSLLELNVDLRDTRPRPREQEIRDPALHLVGLLRVSTTVIAVLVVPGSPFSSGH